MVGASLLWSRATSALSPSNFQRCATSCIAIHPHLSLLYGEATFEGHRGTLRVNCCGDAMIGNTTPFVLGSTVDVQETIFEDVQRYFPAPPSRQRYTEATGSLALAHVCSTSNIYQSSTPTQARLFAQNVRPLSPQHKYVFPKFSPQISTHI